MSIKGVLLPQHCVVLPSRNSLPNEMIKQPRFRALPNTHSHSPPKLLRRNTPSLGNGRFRLTLPENVSALTPFTDETEAQKN